MKEKIIIGLFKRKEKKILKTNKRSVQLTEEKKFKKSKQRSASQQEKKIY